MASQSEPRTIFAALLGEKANAVKAYEKAVALNANGTEAREMLRRLR